MGFLKILFKILNNYSKFARKLFPNKLPPLSNHNPNSPLQQIITQILPFKTNLHPGGHSLKQS